MIFVEFKMVLKNSGNCCKKLITLSLGKEFTSIIISFDEDNYAPQLIVLYHGHLFKIFHLLDRRNVFIQPKFPVIKIFERENEIRGSEAIYFIKFNENEKQLYDKFADFIGRFWNYFSYSGLEDISLSQLLCKKCGVLACSCTMEMNLPEEIGAGDDQLNLRISELLQHLRE